MQSHQERARHARAIEATWLNALRARGRSPVSARAGPPVAGHEAPGRLELAMPATARAPGAARSGLTRWLTGRVSDDVLADARLLVSELVTNSVRHGRPQAGAEVLVGAQLAAGVLLLDVRDPGRAGSVRARVPDLARGHGFGLQLVNMLASRWGIERHDGTRVWLELTHVPAGESAPGAGS